MFWIIRDTNKEATQYYFDVIQESIKRVGYDVCQVDNVNMINEDSNIDFFVVATLFDAMKLFLKRKKNIIVWFQGAFAEESFMKHSNKFRKLILRLFERYTLVNSKLVIFVSNEMKRHYSELFKINLDNKAVIMPCFNSKINKESFYKKDKYKNNVFCYAGSMSVWQNIDEILTLYQRIEKMNLPNTKLLMLTKEKEKAKELLEEYKVQNYEIDFVSVEKLTEVLDSCKYGFIVRKDNIVNRVSTPTKISTYLANGLIPIYNEVLVDFNQQAKHLKYKVISSDIDEQLNFFASREISADEVYQEYKGVFDSYFCTEYYIELIKGKLVEVLKK